MQACIDSGDFFTVGILAAAKFFLENPFYCTKKINGFYSASQRQNRQGFLRIHDLKPLILQAFKITVSWNAL
jgi:hypothetical protein